MKNYLQKDEWNIIENSFIPEYNEISESIFSIGNGHQGQRANFEEKYSGKTLQGSYMAGVYYPDKTRVGWWKNGYPEYFAKVLNAANWIGIDITIDGEVLDLAKCKVLDFQRVLNMKEGYLERSFTAEFSSGKQIKVNSKRFVSIVNQEIGAIRYSITPLNFSGNLQASPYLDFDVKNKDSNYDEKFWDEVEKQVVCGDTNKGSITAKTKKTGFVVCSGISFKVFQENKSVNIQPESTEKEKFLAYHFELPIAQNQATVIYKYTAQVTSRDYAENELNQACAEKLNLALEKGFETMLAEQAKAWEKKWEKSDITIEGDVEAQQGIRFNIFQLDQTYTGEDERLNIGPKGFTGEKYGGSTYWDTEAYCLAFYLATADEKVAKNLVYYRYKHLQKAIENAEKLGFTNGAALYPMVTMNGEECHNEWEITFEEIHRNGAIARAIYDYVEYTGDKPYLAEYGLEVLVAIARFWAQRVNFSHDKQKYVMLGVTGPNEYENNINNNWYTNMLACWCLDYAREIVGFVKENYSTNWVDLAKKINFEEATELNKWQDITANMYFPESKELGVFLQQDGYLDKEQILVKDLPASDRPINQKWSWDRILRSCFIKQADTLQGVYLFEDRYDLDTIRRNFEFYEQRTVHESSLSPCVHAILAAKLGMQAKAYEMYLRTSRLDLDDYNNDTEDGLHITSMAGTWMAVVQGFGGMRLRNGQLHFSPFIPEKWQSYSFKINFRGTLLQVTAKKDGISFQNLSDKPIELMVYGKPLMV